MNHLLRALAPISDAAWEQIEDEAQPRAAQLPRRPPAGRLLRPPRLGALGARPRPGGPERPRPGGRGCESRLRRVQPLVELRTPVPAGAVRDRRRRPRRPRRRLGPGHRRRPPAALAEDRLVFQGFPSAGVRGIVEPPRRTTRSPSARTTTATRTTWPRPSRPCGAPASPGPTPSRSGRAATPGVIETTEHGGYPVLEHLRLITGGPVVWAPAVDGAVVLSQRGDDFELVVGQDLSIGYTDHDARVGRPLPRGEPHLPGRRPRGRGRPGVRRRARRRRASRRRTSRSALSSSPLTARGVLPNGVLVSTAHAAR